MGEGLIVRTFGGSEQTLAPTITEISTDIGTIVFTLTNNDTATAVILYETNDPLPDVDSIQLESGVTSDPITITQLSISPTILYASANAVGKVKSNITEREFTFTPAVFSSATGGTTHEFVQGGKRYRAHVFTSNSDLVVDVLGDSTNQRNQADVLVIAGGGGGGAAGGGAGGFRSSLDFSGNGATNLSIAPIAKRTMSVGNHSIVVGAGGTSANSGANSSALGITSTGGGGANNSGGSAGGRSGGFPSGQCVSGPAITGISGQGFQGGGSSRCNTQDKAGGGGGGGGFGGTPSLNFGVPGGNGGIGGITTILSLSITDFGIINNNQRRFAGGGPGRNQSNGSVGTGGVGGGGNSIGNETINGLANTGGGGAGSGAGGNGGSGIVIIRYEIAPDTASSTKTNEYVVEG